MPLPLTVSCFSKVQIGFTFLVLAHPGSHGQRAIKWVCVCCLVCLSGISLFLIICLCPLLQSIMLSFPVLAVSVAFRLYLFSFYFPLLAFSPLPLPFISPCPSLVHFLYLC